jgi:hypothetical protein
LANGTVVAKNLGLDWLLKKSELSIEEPVIRKQICSRKCTQLVRIFDSRGKYGYEVCNWITDIFNTNGGGYTFQTHLAPDCAIQLNHITTTVLSLVYYILTI